MTSAERFTVRGKRVTVVGAARSGVAAAELLVRRGATVTLTDLRDHIADADRLRDAGVALELGEHRESTLRESDLIVMVEAAAGLAARNLGLEITHQTGERDLELVRDGYRRAGLAARSAAFRCVVKPAA